VTVARTLDARSLVFVDEMGTNTSLSPLYGWSKKGRRAYCAVPRNRGKNTTVLASMSLEGMGPSLAVEGATTARVFETYVERVLAPTLRRGQVVVMDNLSVPTKESELGSSSSGEGASCCTCRRTRRTIEPHRGGFLQDEGPLAQGRGAKPRGITRGPRGSDLGDHPPRRPWLLRALRLRCHGSIVLITAVVRLPAVGRLLWVQPQ
jgi:hypothetical protein